MQTKTQSLIEQSVNVGTGFLIAQLLILYILPLWDSQSLTIKDSVAISAIFTSISLARGYLFRRIFNRWHN